MAVLVAETIDDSLDPPIDELPQLSNEIDLEALDMIIPSDTTPEMSVIFTYQGLRVLVHSGRTVYVQPIPSEIELSVDGAGE